MVQALVGERFGLFSYRNGKPGTDYMPVVHPAIVRELGFDAAVSTRWAAARRADDVFQIPRFTPWDRSRLKFGLRLARNLMSCCRWVRLGRRTADNAAQTR